VQRGWSRGGPFDSHKRGVKAALLQGALRWEGGVANTTPWHNSSLETKEELCQGVSSLLNLHGAFAGLVRNQAHGP